MREKQIGLYRKITEFHNFNNIACIKYSPIYLQKKEEELRKEIKNNLLNETDDFYYYMYMGSSGRNWYKSELVICEFFDGKITETDLKTEEMEEVKSFHYKKVNEFDEVHDDWIIEEEKYTLTDKELVRFLEKEEQLVKDKLEYYSENEKNPTKYFKILEYSEKVNKYKEMYNNYIKNNKEI